MTLATRQPFAELGTPRLHALSSTKNRQNAIAPSFSSSLKPAPTPTTGKRRAASVFDDDQDSENVDPSIFNSPTKRSKTSDGFSKPSHFSLVAPSSRSRPASTASTASPALPSIRKALSSPNTRNSTPISHSRGSPKHKRVGALSKRRVSSSPYRRVDPPSFMHSSPVLPFSIDAALSGTISTYTPKQSVATPTATPTPHASALDETMPNSWFFEIHEDTPEQEASNLMEHSAAVLDISSDDNMETKRLNEDLERGKENIPPPDFAPTQPQTTDTMEAAEQVQVEHVKLPRLKVIAQDAMDEDRNPLSDLPPADFYGEGLDATSYVTVDATIAKPSGLSREFEPDCPSPGKPTSETCAHVPTTEVPRDAEYDHQVLSYSGKTAISDALSTAEEPTPVSDAVVAPQQDTATVP